MYEVLDRLLEQVLSLAVVDVRGNLHPQLLCHLGLEGIEQRIRSLALGAYSCRRLLLLSVQGREYG